MGKSPKHDSAVDPIGRGAGRLSAGVFAAAHFTHDRHWGTKGLTR